MSVHTKTHRTRKLKKTTKKDRGTLWRKAASADIKKYSEGGLMLKGARSKAEVTQKELAEELGISQHHISEMENGKRTIGKEMAKKFAAFFQTDYRIFL
jgi:plasmid maintenance system antidote protein VapI